MECSNCLIYAICQKEWKGEARDECFVRKTDDEGNPLWGKCAGCGCVRQKKQAEIYPCEICRMLALMSPEQQAVTKKRLAQHEILVIGAEDNGL